MITRRQFLKRTVVAAPAIIVASHLMNVWTKPQPEIFTGYDIKHPFDFEFGISHGRGPDASWGLRNAVHGDVARQEGGKYWMRINDEWRQLWI